MKKENPGLFLDVTFIEIIIVSKVMKYTSETPYHPKIWEGQ